MLDFIQATLHSNQTKKAKKTPAKEKHPQHQYLERDFKAPSVLGGWMKKGNDVIVRKISGEWYHKKHEWDERIETESSRFKCSRTSCKVDLSDIDEISNGDGNYSSDELNIEIDWKKGAGLLAHNYLHDNDANHSKDGVLQENVAGLDSALPSRDVLKNWFHAIKISTIKLCSRAESDSDKIHEVIKLKVLHHLDSLANNPDAVKKDYSNFLLKILRLLQPELDNDGQLETKINGAMHHYGKSQLAQMISNKRVPEVQDIAPLELPINLCKRLSPFFQAMVVEITSKDFRHNLTADIHSFQILQQITGFLNIRVKVEQDPGSAVMYKLLGMSKTTFDTLEIYYHRLASEHFEHKKDLLAERFYEMFSTAAPLTVKQSSFIGALQNQDMNKFMEEVEQKLEEQSKSGSLKAEEPTAAGMKAVMEEVQKCYKNVLDDLKEKLKQVSRTDAVCYIVKDGDAQEHSPEKLRESLQKKINAGEALLNNLEATVKALELDDEGLTTNTRLTRFSEWIESHEASIMATYCMGMGASVYYLLQGKSHPPHHYGTGGELPFGSIDARLTSVDPFQVVTTTGAVITQFGQASGWNNDLRRMLEILQDTSCFSFITTELSSSLQSDMINHHLLLKNPPRDGKTSFEHAAQNGSYRPKLDRSKDSLKDMAASALAMESPLQKSDSMVHRLVDRGLRMLGSAASGGLITGPVFAALAKTSSVACVPCCPTVAPVIDFPIQKTMMFCGAAGLIGGAASATTLDYASRVLNYPIRFFADDRTMGGVRSHVDQVMKSMLKRQRSTLIRLLAENPLKAGLNIFGFSLPESFTKGLLHLVDGFISQVEITDFANWRKAHQRLLSTSATFNKVFNGQELTKYDKKMLIDTLGEENAKILFEGETGKRWTPDFTRFIAGAVNMIGYYVMIADLHYFLYKAADKAKQYLDSTVSAISGTTEQPDNRPTASSIEPISPEVIPPLLTNSGNSSDTVSPEVTTPSNTTDRCPADTRKLPQAGKGWLECAVAIYEEFRKGDTNKSFLENGVAWKRFFDVALFKTLPNIACFMDVEAHNKALGKRSYDPAMVVTLEAGIAKNTILGPIERVLQMPDQIWVKCLADIINQANTNVKESMESVGQRERDKASESLKKAAHDVLKRVFMAADFDIHKADCDLNDLVSHWEDSIGYRAMNYWSKVREKFAQEELARCTSSDGNFADYKAAAMNQLETVMPSIRDKSVAVPEDLLGDVELLKARVNQFKFDVNHGKDMFNAVSPLLDALSSVDKRTVDWYVESQLYSPLRKSRANSMKRADPPTWVRVQHKYAQLAALA